MHALNCDILHDGDYAFALIPTYYRPDKFVAAKVYVTYAFHSETAIFYHCQIQELLDNDEFLIDVLPTALFRCIDKVQQHVCLTTIALPALSLNKHAMLNAISTWHSRYLFDIPAPFVVKEQSKLQQLRTDINNYFKSLSA